MDTVSFSDYLIDYLEFEEISQNEFAKSLGINQSQLSMILNKKRKLSFDLMQKIAMITPFKLEDIVKVESEYQIDTKIMSEVKKNNDTLLDYIKRYQYKKLEKYDSNIRFKHIENHLQVVKDIMSYLRISSPYINKENNVLFKSKHDKTELVNIWLEKCYRETKNQTIGDYTKQSVDLVVKGIKKQAKQNVFNTETLVNLFNTNGIYLCIVNDLPGSKIRGAFKVLDTKPAVYITLKHKRPADVYFAMLHELAHCKTDFNSAKQKSFVSIHKSLVKDIDVTESLADQKAFNWMVSDDIFNKIVNEYNDNLIEWYIKHYNLVPMFFVYRLASDKQVPFEYSNVLYQKLNPTLKD